MSNVTHVDELLAAYALGCLDDDDEVLVSSHLADCAACRAELRSYQGVADQLALAVPDAYPGTALKHKLMDRVQPVHAAVATESQQSWWDQLASLWQRAAPVWGLVSLVFILALAVGNLMLRQQVSESETPSGGMGIVSLVGTSSAPGAIGTIVVSLDGEHGTLVVDGLLPLDVAHQYQLWLIKDGQRTSGGVFSVNAEGYGALWVSSPRPLSDYPSFGITIEPAGGSPGPTGEKVLGSSL